MECARVREAISARLDGEDAGVGPPELVAHLAGCPACRAWQDAAHALTRRTRLGGVLPDRELSVPVLAAASVPSGVSSRSVRAVLLLAATAQLALGVLLLVSGEPGAGQHAGHELASFDLALAAAFFVGGLRPRWSAGLVWPVGVAAGGLVLTAVADLLRGATLGLDEAPHLVAVVGALALAWQAFPAWRPGRAIGGRRAGRVDGRRQPGPGDVAALQAAPPPPGTSSVWPAGEVA